MASSISSRDTGRVKRVLVSLLVLAACGGDETTFDWDAALNSINVINRSTITDVARRWCLDDELSDRSYALLMGMSIDDGDTAVVTASAAGCSRYPAELR